MIEPMRRLCAILVGLVALGLVAVASASTPAARAVDPTTLPRLGPSDLSYVGAFLLPQAKGDRRTFAYGGTALAYDPGANGLFVAGHDWYQRSAEVSIPRAVASSDLADLKRASYLQNFADATNGLIDQAGGNAKVGGQLVDGGRLYGTVYVYYDAAGTQVASHWSRPSTSLSSGAAAGLFRVGKVGAGFVSGYLAAVPPEWRSLLGGPVLTGNCCIPIISRTSFGPAAFAFDPAALGATATTPAAPLVEYPQTHPNLGAWDANWDPAHGVLFNGTTSIRGVVFPAGTRSVLFFGTQGTGKFCYGEGTDDPTLDGQPTPDGSIWCYDPDDSYKGTHGYPYAAEVWAYDANDLLAVRNHVRKPWGVRPYAVWQLSLPFDSPVIGGAAYDPASRSLYVSQQYANGPEPVIHVFRTP